MRKLPILHPFLFALFPILFYFSNNKEELSLDVLILPLLIAIILALVAYLLLALILRERRKAGLATSSFFLLFFSYGHFSDLVFPDGRFLNIFKLRLQIGNFVIGPNKVLFFLWIIFFAYGILAIARSKRNPQNLTVLLNIVSVVLVGISLVSIGGYEIRRMSTMQRNKSWARGSVEKEAGEVPKAGKVARPDMPDVYYLIFDSYASSDTLQEIYDYDNSEFTDYLIKRGFFVASKSTANYPTTRFSLASSLNMKYLNYLEDDVGKESQDLAVIDEMLQDYEVWRLLKPKGYRLVHFGSGWPATDRNKYADLSFRHGNLSEFRMKLIETTILRVFQFTENFVKEDGRQRVLYTFSELAKVPKIDGPKFVFAHMTPPHPPWLFGANGEPGPQHLPMSGGSRKEKQNYVNQLIYVNRKIKTLVDQILSKSKVPPIIILQADHGPSLTFTEVALGHIKDRPTKGNLEERMRIFNAYYLPEVGNSLLYDSITPVNTFRVIFNAYFDAHYELLDDHNYYSTYERPYEFTDVTDTARYR